MRVPLSWLREYVDIDMPLNELADRMTYAGLEVESIENVGEHWDRDKIVVGQIVEVCRHPDADRLTIAVVDSGTGTPEAVVTGAPNIHAGDHGQKVVLARTGATLVDGHSAEFRMIKLKPTKIRGVLSAGMVCSEKELGLSDEHEGILLLEDDAPVGTPLQDYLGDTILDIDLTPNLGRCLSIIGVAREVAALTGAKLRLSEPRMQGTGPSISDQVRIEIADTDLCSRYTASLVRGVQIGPSPAWMQRRLRMAGMRPINNIVDVTNYVMLEWGQPLHAFDYDSLRGTPPDAVPTIVVRRALPGERITTLDGVERQLDPQVLLITDGGGPIGIAGVMGGRETEISQETRNVLLESANFDNLNNRRTSEMLKLPSEASLRFGRGLPAEMSILALQRASDMMRELAGGQIAQGIVDNYPVHPAERAISLRATEVKRLLGIDISRARLTEILESLGFICAPDDDPMTVRVTVPFFRQDVEIIPDLIEEVARVVGYDKIPNTLMSSELPAQRRNLSLEGEEHVRDVLVACGLSEVITYSLTNLDSVSRLDPSRGLPDPSSFVRIANPLTSDREYLRQTLMNSMLEVVRANLRFLDRVMTFEVARVYLPQAGQELPDEPRRLCLAMTGRRYPLSWTAANEGLLDYYDLKGVIETLCRRLGAANASFEPAEHPVYERGRAAALVIGGARVGLLGEVHSQVRDAFDLPAQAVCLAELSMEGLLGATPSERHFQPVSRFPATSRDLALVLEEQISSQRVHDVITEAAGRLLQSLELFDIYRGQPVPEGHKSLAFRLTYQDMERTLTDGEIDQIQARVRRDLERDLHAQVRS